MSTSRATTRPKGSQRRNRVPASNDVIERERAK
jgi:hypothetical protein